ncbi:MAG: energy transducer TonB [Thermodesulfobacteriota bacterium]
MARPAPPAAPVKATSASFGGNVARARAGGRGRGAGTGAGTGAGSGSGTGRGSGTGSALQGYLHKVRSLLEKHKIYPPMARRKHQEGVVVLQFTISADGMVAALGVTNSSGYAVLDRAAQDTVSRIGKFPPIPAELQKSSLKIKVPLSFRLETG